MNSFSTITLILGLLLLAIYFFIKDLNEIGVLALIVAGLMTHFKFIAGGPKINGQTKY